MHNNKSLLKKALVGKSLAGFIDVRITYTTYKARGESCQGKKHLVTKSMIAEAISRGRSHHDNKIHQIDACLRREIVKGGHRVPLRHRISVQAF
jgi:hypothetical protein